MGAGSEDMKRALKLDPSSSVQRGVVGGKVGCLHSSLTCVEPVWLKGKEWGDSG